MPSVGVNYYLWKKIDYITTTTTNNNNNNSDDDDGRGGKVPIVEPKDAGGKFHLILDAELMKDSHWGEEED